MYIIYGFHVLSQNSVQRYEKYFTRANKLRKNAKKMQFSCVCQFFVVILHAFSMVGYSVPARLSIVLIHERRNSRAFIFRLLSFD